MTFLPSARRRNLNAAGLRELPPSAWRSRHDHGPKVPENRRRAMKPPAWNHNGMPYIAALDNDATPIVHPEAWVAPGAVVVGKVRLGRGSSVWYGSVLRGDDERIEVGADCNIQDLCCLHADP